MADSKDPRSPMKAKPTECSAAIHGTLPSDNVASYRRADCYEPGTEAVTVEVDTRLIEYCNTSRLLPLEEFAIKILRLPEDWRNTWSEQLERTTKLPDWKTYEETWYRESQGRLNDLFLQLCNKAIVTMTGGRECTSSLGVYEHDKGVQNSYTKCLLGTADTLWGWSKQAEGMLNGMKVFVGFDKGFKKICWEQIQMFLEIKNTSNGSTFGGHET
ncbi:hypothetical protein L218DRAFT_244745 [Marasmius fiardii PR-910]|nr:hypothetical protein L218DRAFT_244745 [Marasmius fiardii PR-910]